MSTPIPPRRRVAIQRSLLAWYDRHRRDLPWRRTRDPYRIWLSEAMLQQTRVETVIPYYERFLARFPSVDALARADEQEVLRAWSGLGYYSRARHLHRAAGLVVSEFGGELPSDEPSLRALPGVGAYTAGAIRSIAFDQAAPVVDGNVTRVLARLFALPRPEPREIWSRAAALVPERRAGDFNQALMELGATLCTPRSPGCARCPWSRLCRARAQGSPEAIPEARPRRPPIPVRALCGAVARGRMLLLWKRPSRGLLGGLWELPSMEGRSSEALVAKLEAATGVRTRPGGRLGRLEHVFSHRRLDLEVVRLERTGGRLRSRAGVEARWCGPRELEQLPLSRLSRKTLALARRVRGPGSGSARLEGRSGSGVSV
ncbi:MAG: A/G-specific adenine glycosylase [Myxococcota bacterium]